MWSLKAIKVVTLLVCGGIVMPSAGLTAYGAYIFAVTIEPKILPATVALGILSLLFLSMGLAGTITALKLKKLAK